MDNYQAVYDAVRSRLSNCDIGQAVQDVIRQTWDISFAVQGISQTAHAAADLLGRKL